NDGINLGCFAVVLGHNFNVRLVFLGLILCVGFHYHGAKRQNHNRTYQLIHDCLNWLDDKCRCALSEQTLTTVDEC
ncbi:MAG: hypothetical protein ACI97X_000318, partial [Oceanospirillaceae bacterium]